jgi:hypothetical protein
MAATPEEAGRLEDAELRAEREGGKRREERMGQRPELNPPR